MRKSLCLRRSGKTISLIWLGRKSVIEAVLFTCTSIVHRNIDFIKNKRPMPAYQDFYVVLTRIRNKLTKVKLVLPLQILSVVEQPLYLKRTRAAVISIPMRMSWYHCSLYEYVSSWKNNGKIIVDGIDNYDRVIYNYTRRRILKNKKEEVGRAIDACCASITYRDTLGKPTILKMKALKAPVSTWKSASIHKKLKSSLSVSAGV